METRREEHGLFVVAIHLYSYTNFSDFTRTIFILESCSFSRRCPSQKCKISRDICFIENG